MLVRFPKKAAVIGVAAAAAVGLVPAAATSAGARPPRPVITSVQASAGSSVGYAHIVIRGRHLSGGTVTVAGHRAYARVVSSRVIAAFPAGHRHGTRFAVKVRTRAGVSNTKRYEFRYVRPAQLRATPAGSTTVYSAIRCAAAGRCVAIGQDGSRSAGLLARITGGGRAVVRRIPLPADYARDGTAQLADLACPTTTFCAAVGSYNAGSAGLVSTWNGTSWTSRRVPEPAGGDSLRDLSTVSCGAARHCIALDGSRAYVLDGVALTVATRLAPAAVRHATLDRVSCATWSWCAVFGSGDVGSRVRSFVAVRAGASWTSRTLATPAVGNGRFPPDVDGADCARPNACTLLAGTLAGGLPAPLFAGTMRGSSLRWTKIPLPADAKRRSTWIVDRDNGSALHCPSTGVCWALAAYSVPGLSGRRGFQPVALRLPAGRAARVYALPRPVSSRTGRMTMLDLSCATADSCVAVGQRGDSDVNNVRGDAIVERFARGVWTPAAAPSPAGRPKYSGYEFTSIDCPTAASCAAVGDVNYAHNPDAEDGQPLQKQRAVALDVVAR